MRRVLVFLTIALLNGCSDDDSSLDLTPPNFSVTPLAIDQVDSFIGFGESLTASQLNPAIEYFTVQSDAEVRSVSEGIVVDIRTNTNVEDFEIWIRPSNNSGWLIIYDHVLNLETNVGDRVDAAQELGTVGIGNRVELQINDYLNIAHCPLQFGTENFVQQHNTFSEDWCIALTVIP